MAYITRSVLYLCRFRSIEKMPTRTLFNLASLGIDSYVATRKKVEFNSLDMKARFKTKMTENCAPESHSMILTDDLKNLLHSTGGDAHDMNLVEQMLLKFTRQHQQMKFGTFVFGPVVMRMYYYLNKPAEALKMFTHRDMKGFFCQKVSYLLLMDLLFNNQMYQEVINVFESVKTTDEEEVPKNCVLLCFAACYKLNTDESFHYAQSLLSDLVEMDELPERRAITFAAGLALSRGAPHIALEMISSVKPENNFAVRNLRAAALADLNRPYDVLPILSSIVERAHNRSATRSGELCPDIFEKVRCSVERLKNNDMIQLFQKIEKELLVLNCIGRSNFESIICSEISSNPRAQEGWKYRRGGRRYRQMY